VVRRLQPVSVVRPLDLAELAAVVGGGERRTVDATADRIRRAKVACKGEFEAWAKAIDERQNAQSTLDKAWAKVAENEYQVTAGQCLGANGWGNALPNFMVPGFGRFQ